MADFYKMDPSAWDMGTANLSLEEEAAYLRIVNAMHKHKSAIPDNDRVFAGMFRTSTRKARSLLAALADAGKIKIQDGFVSNDRAVSDLVHRGFVTVSRAESGAKGGRTRAENVAKALKDNDEGQAIASSRVEKSREEKKEGAKAPSLCADHSQHFSDFWEAYPHRNGQKKNRKGAESAFSKAIISGVDVRRISEGVEAMRRAPDVLRGFARDPTTWLNQQGWTDEIPEQLQFTNGGNYDNRTQGHSRQPRVGDGSATVTAFADLAAKISGRAQ